MSTGASTRSLAVVVLVVIGLTPGPAVAGSSTVQHYHAVPIIAVDGGTIWASAMNDRAQVVGATFYEYGQPRGFIWQDGRMTRIDSTNPQCPSAMPTDVNNRGQVVGFLSRNDEETPCNAFLWENGRLTDLGFSSAGALAINDRGQVLASPYLLHRGRRTELGSTLIDINNRGQVARLTDVGHGPVVFLWQRGRSRLLSAPGSEVLDVVDLNNRGWILGYDFTRDRAVLWTPSLIYLGISGQVSALNDRGQVVGTVWSSDFMPRGVLWQGGRIFDLTALGGPAFSADINSHGQILGDDTLPDGSGRTAVFSPN